MSAAKTPPSETRVLPADWDLERAFLGGLILDSDQLVSIRATVTPEHLHKPSHGALYRLLLAFPGPFDVSHVMEAATGREDCGGLPYVVDVPNAWHGENLEAIGEILVGLWRRRELIRACQDTMRAALDRSNPIEEVLADAEKRTLAITSAAVTVDGWAPFSEIIPALIPEFERRQALYRESEVNGGGVIGMSTRLPMLDAMTQGLHRTDLTVLAARPGAGKTVLALNLAIAAAMAGETVGVFSLEMAARQLGARTISSEGDVPAHDIRSGNIGRHWGAIIDAVNLLTVLPIFVDQNTAQTAATLRAKARRLKQQHPGLSVIILDYLQLASGGERGGSREQEVSLLSRTCKIIAGELDVSFIAVSQLSRKCEERSDKRPMPSDLRDSGAIEQDADNIWFLYRDDCYNESSSDKGLIEIIIAKQRNGPLGTVKCGFRGDLMKVVPLDENDPRHNIAPEAKKDTRDGWKTPRP